MGWFDEQIRQRIENDDEMFSDAFASMMNLVSNEKIISSFKDNRQLTLEAVGDILDYYHIKASEVPDNIDDINDMLEFLLRPSGIMRRSIKLSDAWYKDGVGAMLGTKKDGSIIALLPKINGYYYKDYTSDKLIRVTKENAKEIDQEAICFYEPFPMKKLGMSDILKYIFSLFRSNDYLCIFTVMIISTILGMFTPRISQYLYGTVLNLGSVSLLAGAILTLLCITIASNFISIISNALNAGISTRVNLSIESAFMMRVLSLPADFFKQYSSGELANRVIYVNELCKLLFETIFTTGLTAIFSLCYLVQIARITPTLFWPSCIVLFLTLAVSLIASLMQINITEKQMIETSKENGLVFSLINGVTKIKVAGGEKRAFAKWSKQYVNNAKYTYQPPIFLKLSSTITTAISLLGTIIIYYVTLNSNIAVADYMAFVSAYGLVSGAFATLSTINQSLAQIKSIFKIVSPILETEPEVDVNRHVINSIRGGIELNNIYFRYSDSMPYVLDDLSLKIRPGQYVAIVGKTGCGKSTLLRILLGFEKPEKGAVYYDGKDISSLDLKSLRRKIGVVMQNGKLFQGDIYSNIVISAPWLTLDDAWKAAEIAGLADDIKSMPMGMSTMIGEGIGGISGGQKQRLMIARAIAPKPKILMFDEATSALDNITQKKVSNSLDSLKCTRIVIAHRLSTIKHADRIIVLDKGKIVEDGTYDELIKLNGHFSELVNRQRVDFD